MANPEQIPSQRRASDAAWNEARDLRLRGQFEVAAQAYGKYAISFPSDERADLAGINVLYCLAKLTRWSEVESHSMSLLGGDRAAQAFQYLGEALLHQGKREDARVALERAIELDPQLTEARNLLISAKSEASSSEPAPKWRSWPGRESNFEDVETLIRRYVLAGMPRPRFLGPDSVFFTLGSCFAHNLGRRLRIAGHTVYSEPIGEEVNSTYANRIMLDWLEHGPDRPETQIMEECYGPETRTRMAAGLKAANVVVLTMGVAPTFFNRETGAFAFMYARTNASREYFNRTNVMRTTTVQENVDNVLAILASIRRICGARVVLTVSPVPLGATNEMPSAVIADCISKSTLRVACDEVVRTDGQALYWPSFEIVRWLGPSLPRKVFGEEDGNTRHVSEWIVSTIVQQFIDWYGVPEAAGA